MHASPSITESTSPANGQKLRGIPALPRLAGLGLLLALSIFAVAPLFYPGQLQTHSGFVPAWNILDLRLNLGNFAWMPHTLTTFDPLRSNGLLPYYLAALLPLSPMTGVKLLMGLGWLAGGVGIYLWLRDWLGSAGAMVAGLVYVYLPYQLVNVYVRGAWAEVLFFGLLPWAILAATYLVTSPKLPLVPIVAIFWLACGLSQLGLTVIALVLLAGLVLVVHRPQALLPIIGAAAGTALAIALYLLLPVPFWQPAPHPITDHLLYPFQLFSARWGFGASRPGWNDDLSLQLGLAAIGLSIIAITLWQRHMPSPQPSPCRRGSFSSPPAGGIEGEEAAPSTTRSDPRLLYFLAMAVILSLLTLGGGPVWAALGGLLSYPWQLLGLAGLALAVLAGAALWLDTALTRLPLLAAIVIAVILSVYPYLLPQFIQPQPAWLSGAQAQLGDNQLVLLAHHFSVQTTALTAGLGTERASLPLSLNDPLRPNDMLQLEVVWQPLRPFEQNLKVFVHLVDAEDTIIAQFDGQPLEGTYPTADWQPGEIIADNYPVQLPDPLPPGPYRAFVGLYDESTFARLPVPGDDEGRVILDVK